MTEVARLLLSFLAITLTLNRIWSANALNEVGVCYGLQGDNLPSPYAVIGLFKQYQIGKMRLFAPQPEILNALRGTQIEVTLGVRNEDLPSLAASQDAANGWFAANVAPYVNDVSLKYVTVGNEAIPGMYAPYVAPAMWVLHNVLSQKGLSNIKVTTVVPSSVLGVSFPPSAGAFSPDAAPAMTTVLSFLAAQGTPLMINVYPYFAYASDPANIPLDYALFTASAPILTDGWLRYYSLFDATVDAFLSAMEKAGGGSVNVAVSESGWPSAGNGNLTTPELAGAYNRNFIKKILSKVGTPKRPSMEIEGFVFAMFNENLKPAGVEQNFGLFYPDMRPVYNVF